jgi:catechol 2,3-dioxygenase-like lactoylglutathione lyase family enzyme
MQTTLTLDSIGMNVSDMERAIQFFTQQLSFQPVLDTEVSGAEYDRLQGLKDVHLRIVRLQLGQEILELTEYLHPKGKPIPADSRSNDLWFEHIAIVTRDMEKAYSQLSGNIESVSTEPQRIPDWNKAAAGIKAFKFRDRDEHNLELLQFPPGKGNPKWQQTHDRLFLGIDHTAISISNTDNSCHFYDGLLGMRLAGKSLNHGIEQELLDNVPGARVLITSHQPDHGPGIEFLNYLEPSDARPRPSDTQSNDLIHWQIRMVVEDVAVFAERLKAAEVRFVSSGITSFPDRSLGFSRAIQVLDPDGHAIQLVDRTT